MYGKGINAVSRTRNFKRIYKLSRRHPENSWAELRIKLAGLKQLTEASNELAHDIEGIADQLKKIAAPQPQPYILTTDLNVNEQLLRDTFKGCDDVKFHLFQAAGRKVIMIYLDGMADVTTLQENVLKPLLDPELNPDAVASLEMLSRTVLTVASITITSEAKLVIKEIMGGNAAILIDGTADVMLISSQKHVKREVEDPKIEGSVKGPHEAFNETLGDNIVLIRRRAKDADIKIRMMEIGAASKTTVALVFKARLVKTGLVEEVERRLKAIDIDRVLVIENIGELIVDHPWSPFPQVQSTEKPETVIRAIYSGRAAIIMENTPTALIIPCTYPAIMSHTEDYAIQPIVASAIRLTRYAAALAGAFLPAFYIALIAYHPGVLPTTLAISVAELRARTPFPAFMEALFMEALLELFQEAIVRLPPKVAPAASMVGAFVIGTTVVQAGLVNPLLVVIIAATAISSYTMASYGLSLALRWLRIPMILCASVLGMYGLTLGYLALTVHMCSLRSFGESYLGNLFDVTLLEDVPDTFVRMPIKWHKTRPKVYGAQERARMGNDDEQS